MSFKVETLFAGLNVTLGEAPIWNDATNELLFVDSLSAVGMATIFGKDSVKEHMQGAILYKYNEATGIAKHVFKTHDCLATVIPTNQKNTYVLGFDRDVVSFHWEGEFEEHVLASVEKDINVATRINDAKADRNGRLWFGTMNTEWSDEKMNVVHEGMGSLYMADGFKLDRKTPVKVVKQQTTPADLGAGCDWSPDNKTMYFGDSGKRVVYAYDYDATSGKIGNERVAVDFRKQDAGVEYGVVDSVCVDATGNIWVACYGAGSVCCFDKNTGKMVVRVAIPCLGATGCCFGGPNMDQLFVTTVSAAAGWANGGDVYRVDGLNVHGQPTNRVTLH